MELFTMILVVRISSNILEEEGTDLITQFEIKKVVSFSNVVSTPLRTWCFTNTMPLGEM
jgi:hypothetical protein